MSLSSQIVKRDPASAIALPTSFIIIIYIHYAATPPRAHYAAIRAATIMPAVHRYSTSAR